MQSKFASQLDRQASSRAHRSSSRKMRHRADSRFRKLPKIAREGAHTPSARMAISVLVAALGICIVFIVGTLSRTTTPNAPANPNAVAFIFAGQTVTNGQLGQAEVGQAKNLFTSGQYQSVQRDSFERGFLNIVDQIEVDKLVQHELANNHGLTQQQALDKLIASVSPLQSVSGANAHAFYLAHPSLFARSGPQLHVREIVVQNEALAERLRQQIVTGASFVQLAQQYSLDPPQYKLQGGDLGWVSERQMPPDWSQVVFGLQKGEVSQPFQSGGQYYIVQNMEPPKYDVIPYADVSPSVPVVAAQYNQSQQFLVWLSAHILREPLDIRDQRLAVPIASALENLRVNPSQSFEAS
jgi:PPIC-type PPIASE domain